NYRLSLAGIAGIIVSIGLTADSFIVYFERIKDEMRNARPFESAVNYGWERAKRTITVSKLVNILASVVLYFVAVGNVRGFAFTLGLTSIADLIVVFMFTHPLMQLLAEPGSLRAAILCLGWTHPCLARNRYIKVPAESGNFGLKAKLHLSGIKRINVPVKKRPKGKLLQNGEPLSERKWSLRINHLMTSLHGRTYESSSYLGERAVCGQEILPICSEMENLVYRCFGTSVGR